MASSDVKQPEGPQADGSPERADASPESSDGAQEGTDGGPEKPAIVRRRGRSGDVAAALVIIGIILVLGFAPAARLTARGLPQPPPSFPSVVTGSQHGKASAVRDVPVGCLQAPASGQPRMYFLMPSRHWGHRMPGP